MPSEYFTQIEAESKINKLVVALQVFCGVPKYTVGEVIRIYGDKSEWRVAIEWKFPHDKRYQIRPLVDGFSKLEYERFLREIK